MYKADKWKFWISLIFRILLAGVAIISLITASWMNLFLSLLTIALTFLPSMFEKRFKIDYPSEFEIVILLFLYASLFLGEINKFYKLFWWWDIFLHTLSGIVIGIFAFSLVYILNYEKNIKVRLNPFFIATFSLCFAISVGVFWEFFEYFMDTFFNLTMQLGAGNALADTMHDLVADTFGAMLVSVLGYFYITGRLVGPLSFMKNYEKKFLEQNPHLFNKHLKRKKRQE